MKTRTGLSKLRHFGVICALILALLTAVIPLGAQDAGVKKDGNESMLNAFMFSMESTVVSADALREIKKLTKDKDVATRMKALSLLAQYTGEGLGDTRSALAMICPVLLLDEKESAGIARILEKSKDQKPSVPFDIDFPKADKWDIRHPEICIAAARILSFMKKYPDALAGFNSVGSRIEGPPRILAAEGLADMQYEMKDFQGSIRMYEFSLSVLAHVKEQSEYSGEKALPLLEKRIHEKLEKAKLAYDAEMYGPGFVAYREARKYEFAGDYIRAAVRYGDIIVNFPETVYSEASSLYVCKCVLEFADAAGKEKAENEIRELEKNISTHKALLNNSGKKMTIRVREMFDQALKEDEALLAKMRGVPVGASAERVASERLGQFIAKDKFGLYREEAMILLGDYHLERKYDSKTALDDYRNAIDVLASVEKAAKILDAYKVPEKASSVSSPPRDFRVKDMWGNTDACEIKPGDIVNRLTSQWYLDRLRYLAFSKYALALYIEGRPEEAVKSLAEMLKYDAYEAKLQKLNYPNSYSRLKSEFQLGRMFATEKELSSFKGKHRTAIITADYYYEIEDWKKAEQSYRRINSIMREELNKNARAYLDYMLINFEILRDRREEALKMIDVFNQEYGKQVPSWANVQMQKFNIIQGYEKRTDEALGLLRQISEAAPDDPLGKYAFYRQAELLYARKRFDEAEKIAMETQKRYKGTWLAKASESMIISINKKKIVK